MAEKRDENGGRDPATGRFGAGNTSGGRRPMLPEVREMLTAATPAAAKRLIEALDATVVVHYLGQEVGTYIDHKTRIAAAEALLSRLHGRPQQEIVGGDGAAVLGLIMLPPEES